MPEREPAMLGGDSAVTSIAADVAPAPERPRPRPRPAVRSVTVVGFWRRLGAGLIDLAIVVPVAALLIALASAIAGIHLPPSRVRGLDFWLDLLLISDPAMITAIVILLAVAMLYLYVFQATLGQTLGMRVLKLRVIDVYGEQPSFARIGVRTAGYLLGLATLSLGFLWIGFDAEKRGLHDWIAGTYVIRT
ncbi:MAG: RDD family protein [Myxococcales bacterium]|nr:RDD family protein [Myxococcales bacterium]